MPRNEHNQRGGGRDSRNNPEQLIANAISATKKLDAGKIVLLKTKLREATELSKNSHEGQLVMVQQLSFQSKTIAQQQLDLASLREQVRRLGEGVSASAGGELSEGERTTTLPALGNSSSSPGALSEGGNELQAPNSAIEAAASPPEVASGERNSALSTSGVSSSPPGGLSGGGNQLPPLGSVSLESGVHAVVGLPISRVTSVSGGSDPAAAETTRQQSLLATASKGVPVSPTSAEHSNDHVEERLQVPVTSASYVLRHCI